jgi:anti-anti-sigma regulatory factor
MEEFPIGGRMLRITRTVANGDVLFRLSGRMDADSVGELERLFDAESKDRRIVLDLKNLTLVDRQAVIFFAKCGADVQIKNCPPYIREWIRGEWLERESSDSSEK